MREKGVSMNIERRGESKEGWSPNSEIVIVYSVVVHITQTTLKSIIASIIRRMIKRLELPLRSGHVRLDGGHDALLKVFHGHGRDVAQLLEQLVRLGRVLAHRHLA